MFVQPADPPGGEPAEAADAAHREVPGGGGDGGADPRLPRRQEEPRRGSAPAGGAEDRLSPAEAGGAAGSGAAAGGPRPAAGGQPAAGRAGRAEPAAGVVSTRVALCVRAGSQEAAARLLSEAVKQQGSGGGGGGGDTSQLWRQSADFSLRCGDPRAAAASLEELRRARPGDVRTVAQLVTAYSQFDPAAARRVSAELPPPQHGTGLDVDALETTSWSASGRPRRKDGLPSPGSPRSVQTAGLKTRVYPDQWWWLYWRFEAARRCEADDSTINFLFFFLFSVRYFCFFNHSPFVGC